MEINPLYIYYSMLPISNLFEFYPAVCEMEHVDTTTSL